MKKSYFISFLFVFFFLSPGFLKAQHKTLVLQPGPADGIDVTVQDIHPNSNYVFDDDIHANTWTSGGVTFIDRGLLAFNLTSIPPNALIVSATLTLHTNLNSMNSELNCGNNAAWLIRAIEPWKADQVTWNTQPAIATTNFINLPQNIVNDTIGYAIDVLYDVQDMVANPEANFGWLIKLHTEELYTARIFASSDNTTPAWRPKLSIVYVACTPPKAGFYFNFADTLVYFSDTSNTTHSYAWSWDFGDGTFSAEKNPAHYYPNVGSYKVCMTVTDSCGTDSACNLVSFYLPMHVQFSSGLLVTDGLKVAFTDQTTGATSWLWNFGDGQTSTVQNPVHTYQQTGDYKVCLKAGNGFSDATSCDSVHLNASVPSKYYRTEIYPNPPKDNKITIRFEQDAASADITLYDFIGQMICQSRIGPAKKVDPIEWNIPDLAEGAYFLELRFAGIRKVFKVMIP
ncbi:MAG: PKD domain-containing protein [Bacteroidota bacterium]